MPQFGGNDLKRHFTVVMGGKEHGLYVSSTPSSAARKAVTKLCAANKSKKVEFEIREITQGSKKKTYGPYEGHIEKLKEPIELKGRVIKYKPVAKLSGKSGVKKGGMRGGGWIDDLKDYNPIEKNFMKEFEKSLINKLKEKMKTINMSKAIKEELKEELLRHIKESPSRYDNIYEEIQSLPDKRINELIEKVEDMLQDINMYETWRQEFKKLGDYSENEKKFMEYFCGMYISYMARQLRSNDHNYSMLNGIKKSLKNSGHHSNIEEKRIDQLINTVKIKHLGIFTKWVALDISEIEKRFARSVEKFVLNKFHKSENTNFSNSELQEILKKNPEYLTIKKSSMNKLISYIKTNTNELESMY